MALSDAAREWDKKAALIIGARAGEINWQAPSPTQTYRLIIYWGGGRHDVDAPIKLVQDCVTRKLGFDDRYILRVETERVDKPGVAIYLDPYDPYPF